MVLHEETMDSIIGDQKCRSKKYICCDHEFEVIKKDKTLAYNGRKITQSFKLTVPVGAGMKSSLLPSQTSKGIGGERAMCHQLE